MYIRKYFSSRVLQSHQRPPSHLPAIFGGLIDPCRFKDDVSTHYAINVSSLNRAEARLCEGLKGLARSDRKRYRVLSHSAFTRLDLTLMRQAILVQTANLFVPTLKLLSPV
ncbi:hypothetical protein PoB_004452300 [Plakobranchus ocellatus]|uniref:Uncharacterized protein n=1 Tax=Plakobranchus ocellatus TaxID=259542 RepID=A0AAV4BFT2_9GAST|nr:hypothetical protein PoB_004452300 [Plakobranchus ocellatus]